MNSADTVIHHLAALDFVQKKYNHKGPQRQQWEPHSLSSAANL